MLITGGGWEKSDIDEAFHALQLDASKVPTGSVETTLPAPIQDEVKNIEQPLVAQDEPVVLQVRSERPSEASEMVPPRNEHIQQGGRLVHDEDDFLGIFAGNTHSTPVEAGAGGGAPTHDAEPVHMQEASAATAPAFSLSHETKKDEVKEIERSSTVESTASTKVLPLEDMLASVTHPTAQEETHIIKEHEAPQFAAPEGAITAQPLPPTSTGVHFDLSSLRKPEPAPLAVPRQPMAGTSAEVLDAVALPKTPPVEASKPIETKSVAELWLEKKETPVSTRPEIVGKRTMASDILLRGKGAAIRGLPAISVPGDTLSAMGNLGQANREANPDQIESTRTPASPPVIPRTLPAPKIVQPNATDKSESSLSAPTDPARKQKVKKVLAMSLGLLATLVIFGGAFYAFFALRGPSITTVLSATLGQFVSATSFTYSGVASSSLVLSTATDGIERSGTIGFATAFAGQLKNDKSGYGDGSHHVKFSGGLQSGDFKWSTDIESDVRMVANELYFHVSSFPANAGIDPDVFKTYWVKVDLAEIAKELALSGVAMTQGGYGDFGSGSDSGSFNALLTRYHPFSAAEKLDDGTIGGAPAIHMKLKTDPEQMQQFMNAMYTKYTGKDLTLDADQGLRLKDALAKINIEIWVDATTNVLEKFSADVLFDDDIAGVHVKGPVHIDFTFTNYNADVAAALPTPVLSLEELQSRMGDYQKQREVRGRDAAKFDAMVLIQNALANYLKDKGRYPTVLAELRQSGKLATSTISDNELKRYVYASYVKPDVFNKANRCNAKSKNCSQYHIGINFEDPSDPLLQNDNDQISEVFGGDTAGCGNESNVACYDLLSPATTSTAPSP